MYQKRRNDKAKEKLSRQLIAAENKKPLDNSSLNDLKAVLRFHEYRYYIENDPLIADGEYDRLYKALEELKKTILL